jgi:hypothetical protein
MGEEVYIDRVSRTIISALSKEVARELSPFFSAEIKAAVRQEIEGQLGPLRAAFSEFLEELKSNYTTLNEAISAVHSNMERISSSIINHLQETGLQGIDKGLKEMGSLIKKDIDQLYQLLRGNEKILRTAIEDLLKERGQDTEIKEQIAMLSAYIKGAGIMEDQRIIDILRGIERLSNALREEKEVLERALSMMFSISDEMKRALEAGAEKQALFEHRQFEIIKGLITFMEENLPDTVTEKIKSQFSLMAERLSELNDFNRSLMNFFQRLR